MSNLPPPPPPPPPAGGRGRGQQRPEGPRGFGSENNEGGGRGPGGLPRWSIWVLVGVMALAFLLPNLWPRDRGEELTYTEFIEQVEAGKVESIEISNDSGAISGEFTDGTEFTSTGGGDRALSDSDFALLDEKGVDYTFKAPSSNWLLSIAGLFLPVLLIIGFFVWMQRRAAGQMGNVMSIGRSKAKAYSQDKPSTTFSDIAGYEGVKTEITEVVDFLRMPERFREIGARVPKGILLVGPPGTGKTLFARAVAGEAGVGFLSVTGSDFMEMFVGVGASRVRDLFQQARRMGRAIIFIDEIDSIGRKRGAGLGGGHDEREQTLNQMLAEMDGFETSEGIVIMAATNRPDILDPALLRPGRFDRTIVVPLPSSPSVWRSSRCTAATSVSALMSISRSWRERRQACLAPTSPTSSTRLRSSPCGAAPNRSSGSTSRTPAIGWCSARSGRASCSMPRRSERPPITRAATPCWRRCFPMATRCTR